MKKLVLVIPILVAVVVLTACSSRQKPLVVTQEDTALITQYQANIATVDSEVATDVEKSKVVVLSDNGSVYYYGADGKRYIFPTQETFASWFGDYVPAKSLPLEEMQKVPLGGNVTMKPGTLLTTESDPKIYLITQDSTISPVDERVLEVVYGKDYKNRVIDIPNYYFTNYSYGPEIITVDGFPDIEEGLTIDYLKGLHAQ
ncbi:hypothetical protein IT409_01905 [Candidatus Falkowbacteria bacterium]|nr:hypothetical protein [Candidatus Falkowbacteria bacterium]